MCTLVVAPYPSAADAEPTMDGRRLVVNRDELHTRAAAYPPEVRACGRHAVLMPIDPASDGTWVGVSDAGIAASLLNRTPPGPLAHQSHDGSTSRGTIIPHVLAADTLADAIARAEQLDPAQFDLFRLVLCDAQQTATLVHTGEVIELASETPLTRPTMWASSGLGDERAHQPRQQLLDEMLADQSPEQWVAAIDQYMQHRWADNTEQSVWMWREAARTVSRTEITITDRRVALRYQPVDEDGSTGALAELALSRAGAGVR